jgi:signal transduction histidine kinase
MNNTFTIDIIPANDPARVAALRRYRLLDSPGEKVFDDMTSLAAVTFGMPISLISLVDAETVFFTSTQGVGNIRCADRGESLCALAILSPEVMVFENALEAEVLSGSPAVHGPAAVRFYAGAPLTTKDGFLIGTICVIDQQPHLFSAKDRLVLQQLAGVVMEQIELRLAALTDIERQQQLAEEKQEFISVASHELRTPVTTLTASLQLLLRLEDQLPATAARLLGQANKSVLKINKLIADLLDVNRIAAGHLQLDKKTFTLSRMINDSCTHIRLGGTHHLLLSGDQTLEVCADEQKIDQVIVNLANNAVKYAPEAPDILIRIEREGIFARISLTDHGPGISKEKQPNLFDRYYRAAGAQAAGLGLGLYISAQIVRQHGGEIGVESEPGQGSTFWFTLPLF